MSNATPELEMLRGLLLPAKRPDTVADYIAPILAYLDARASIEADGRTENDEMRVACWLRDAIANDRAAQTRAAHEVLSTRVDKARDTGRDLRARNDALLDQLSALLPENVDRYLAALPWSADATDEEKTLVAGNLRAFASAVRSHAPIPTEEAGDRA